MNRKSRFEGSHVGKGKYVRNMDVLEDKILLLEPEIFS